MGKDLMEIVFRKENREQLFQHLNIASESYNFTGFKTKRKRRNWYLFKGLRSSPYQVDQEKALRVFKKIVKDIHLVNDKNDKDVLVYIDILFEEFKLLKEKSEVENLLRMLLDKNKNNPKKCKILHLTKLKHDYLERIDKDFKESDLLHLKNLLTKKRFMNNKQFHYLNLRFQVNQDKYLVKRKAKQFSLNASLKNLFEGEEKNKNKKSYVKYLTNKKNYFEAIFVMQNHLASASEFGDVSYYFSKKILKICKAELIEIPQILWTFWKHFRRSKKIVSLICKTNKWIFILKIKNLLG